MRHSPHKCRMPDTAATGTGIQDTKGYYGTSTDSKLTYHEENVTKIINRFIEDITREYTLEAYRRERNPACPVDCDFPCKGGDKPCR